MLVNKLDHTIMWKGMKIVPENWNQKLWSFLLEVTFAFRMMYTYYYTLMRSTLVQPQPRIIYVWPQPLLTDGFDSWAKKRGKSCQSLVGRPKIPTVLYQKRTILSSASFFAWNQNGGSTMGFFLSWRNLTALKKPLRSRRTQYVIVLMANVKKTQTS